MGRQWVGLNKRRLILETRRVLDVLKGGVIHVLFGGQGLGARRVDGSLECCNNS